MDTKYKINITKCYWTSAIGDSGGYWARATKLADLDNSGNFLPNTSWSVDIHNAVTLLEAETLLDNAIRKKLGIFDWEVVPPEKEAEYNGKETTN